MKRSENGAITTAHVANVAYEISLSMGFVESVGVCVTNNIPRIVTAIIRYPAIKIKSEKHPYQNFFILNSIRYSHRKTKWRICLDLYTCFTFWVRYVYNKCTVRLMTRLFDKTAYMLVSMFDLKEVT